MGSIARGGKNAFRNPIRTVSVALIVGLSIGLALIMVLSVEAVQTRIDSVTAAIGSRITISPAGSVMGVGGAPLTSAQLGDLAHIQHVTKVIKTMSAQIAPKQDTDLDTSVKLPAAQNSAMGGVTMPVFGTGTDDIADYKLTSGHDLKLVSGALIDPKSDANAALVGKGIADVNHLSVGSTFTAYGTPVTVRGIFDTKNMWANNVVIFPLAALERIASRPDQVSMVYVEVDSADDITAVQSTIANTAGAAADMTTTGDLMSQAAGPLQDIKKIATEGLAGSLVVGAVTIFLIMLMVVRERRREIGVLKAIGASGTEVVLQFVAEAFVLAVIGAVVGGVIGLLMTNAVFSQLVLNSHAASAAGQPVSAGVLEVGFKAGWGAFSVVRNANNGLHATIGFGLVLYGLLVALAIAMLGSAIPAWLISRIRPAEVMRGE
jgi:putative ABC transport system permease protein